jgi:Ca2+-binding RTX toxin-like protein
MHYKFLSKPKGKQERKMATYYGNGRSNYYGGSSSNDFVYGYGGNDSLYGWLGNDKIYGGTGRDIIYGEGGNDTLWGDEGVDRLYGGNDNDTVRGGDGNDYVNGGNGQDVLFGGRGNDVMWGGTGVDNFNFLVDNTSSAGRDTIKDFDENSEYINLSNHGYWELLDTDNSGSLTNADLWVTQYGNKTVIDVGGAYGFSSGNEVLTVFNSSSSPLDENDFSFV